jgi:hypothetical protein
VSGLRAGEIDIGQVFGDHLEQARKAGRIHAVPNSACTWVILSRARPRPIARTTARRVPGRRPQRQEEPGKRAQVRLAMNWPWTRSHHQRALEGDGPGDAPSRTTTIRSTRATAPSGKSPTSGAGQKLLAEAGRGGFEIRTPRSWCMRPTADLMGGGPRLGEGGDQVERVPE